MIISCIAELTLRMVKHRHKNTYVVLVWLIFSGKLGFEGFWLFLNLSGYE